MLLISSVTNMTCHLDGQPISKLGNDTKQTALLRTQLLDDLQLVAGATVRLEHEPCESGRGERGSVVSMRRDPGSEPLLLPHGVRRLELCLASPWRRRLILTNNVNVNTCY